MKASIRKIVAVLVAVMLLFTNLLPTGIAGALKAYADITTYPVANENFYSLGNNATATLPTNWKASKEITVTTVGSYNAVTAVDKTERLGGSNLTSSASNGIYNFGVDTGYTHRAVGFISSGSATKSGNLYYKWTNDTGSNIGSFDISYDVEKFRNGSNAQGFSIVLYYSLDGDTWTNAGDNLKISFNADADTNGAADVPISTQSINNQKLNISLPNGQPVYFAWNYSVTSGTTTSFAQGLGITNVLITAESSGGIPAVSIVTANLNSGAVVGGTPITLETSTVGADIHYSIYSPYPTLVDSGIYSAPITLNFNEFADPITIKAYASAADMDDSAETSWTFTQAKLDNVTAAPAGGEVTAGTSVTLNAAAGATIYYTTNGDTPSISSSEYTGEITISSLPYTIKAIAVKNGYVNSNTATFSYTAASQQSYSPDGENGTAVEWALSSGSSLIQPIAATGGDLKSGSNLTCWFGAAQPTLTFGSNGANCSGWNDGMNTKYWMVQISTKSMADLNLSWRMRSSSTGPRDFKVQYSTDNRNTWIDVPDSVIKVPNAGSLFDAANLFSVALPNATFNKDTIHLRWIMTSNISTGGINNVGSGGTHQFNNIAITGAYLVGDNQAYAATADIADHKVPLGSVVTFSSRTSDADIKYSTDGGNTYTTADNKQVTLAVLPITLHVKAVKDSMDDSRVKTFSFTQAKVASVSTSPKAGAVPSNGTITLTTEPADAAIKYTIIQKAGTAEETVLPEADYTAPIALTEDMFPLRITAMASKENYIDSDLISFNYTAQKPTGGEKNYFGQLHSHTTNSDGAGTLAEAFAWARDNAKLDFFAVTDHSNSFDTAPAGDKAGTYNLGAYNKNNVRWQAGITAAADAVAGYAGKYVAFYGFEMTWSGGPGHMNTFNTEGFVSRNNTELNSKTNDAGLRAYYDLLKLHPESISQFNHPGTTFGNFSSFGYYDPVIDERITLIEVGNGEGAIGSGGYFPSYEQYDMALDKGWHVAPTNNQDNHKALWGNSNTARTVIYTNDFTTEGIYQAMKDMRVYATEDVNLDIIYTLNDEQLGTILDSVPATATFKVDAKNVAGSNKVKSIAIITNGGVEAYKQNFGTKDAALNYTMTAPKAGYYYIKVVQEDGRIAVTAPVWLGKADNVGISGFTSSSSTPVTTEALTLTTEVFNNEASIITLNSVKYQIKGGAIIADNILNTSIAASSTVKNTQSFTPTEAMKTTIIVTASVKVNGVDKTYTKEIELNVRDITKLKFIAIDASHLNEYVAGNYKDGMKNFSTIAMQYGLRTVILNTSAEFIAAAADPKYQMFIITAPTRRLDPASGITHKYYSNEELTAIANFAKQGKPVVITGWGDFYESYAYVTQGLENHMAGQQNKLLAAIGSALRIGDDEAKDDVNNGGQSPRLYLDDHNNRVSPLLKGMLDGQKFSQYGGSTIYAINPDGTPATTLPSSVTPIVSGHSTTYSVDDDHDGYGFEDPTIMIPRYGNSPDAGKGVGKVLLAASETVNHGNGVTSMVVVAGGAFLSDFEIKNTALDNPADAYSNEVIVRNLLGLIENITITPIAGVKAAAEGTEFTIEGIATVSVYDGNSLNNTGFFDSIYVQDSSGGINLFPVANDVQAGQKIRVTGVLSAYQGEKQLAVSSVRILDNTIVPVTPTAVSTRDAMSALNTGKLIKTTGVVTRVVAEPNGIVNEITIDDGSGPAIVYINAYITPSKNLSFVRNGVTISVIGLGSIGENFTSTTDFLPRIRVRDRGEIELVTPVAPVVTYKVQFDSDGGTTVADVTGIQSGRTITLPSAPTKSGYIFGGWFTNKNGLGTAFTASTVVNSDMTVYAKWSEIQVDDSEDDIDDDTDSSIVDESPTTPSVPVSSIVGTKIELTPVLSTNGVAEASISTGEIDTLINNAASLTKATIEITAIAPTGAEVVSVVIPTSAIQSIVETDKMSVMINTGIVSITFNEKALAAIGKSNSQGDVKLSIATVNPDELSSEVRAIVGDRPVYDFTVASGDKQVHDFEGGKAFVKISYTLQPDEDADSVVLFYINSEGRLESVRSVYNTETKCIEAVLNHFSEYAVAYSKVTFNDVPSDAWYAEAVGFIAARGITNGIGNGNFAPSQKLTREQFLVMLMRAYNIAPDANAVKSFDDVSDNYAAPYISAAKHLGIVTGVGENKFAPTKEISRQEMFVMLYNALKVIGELPEAKENLLIGGYVDLSDVANWALPAMTLMVESGICAGTGDNMLSPLSVCDRATAAQIIYNLMK